MMSPLKSLLLLSVFATCCLCSRPPYIGCQNSDECGKDGCCVIGMGRYSIPTCQPRREVGEVCRPLSEPVNVTLEYPDGASVDLSGVFYIMCPCQGGLGCGNDMECVEHDFASNHVDQPYDYSEDSNYQY
ncbi:astakine-like [Macrosteles quadrilineatus]|uniref:astakine-like n=1 Tax=Macrosteles quadrilineatus TaxID=74068 RepID=UPI0023E2962C|nr:astakine-like [Macrosteles quadrilineatus]